MKVKTVTRLSLAAVVMLLLSTYGHNAKALGPELDRYYYTGCGTVTEVGTYFRSCSGHITQTGSQTGDWREDFTMDCDTGSGSHTIWENCSGAWQLRSTLGDCQCSH
jgi:hypothetical protein